MGFIVVLLGSKVKSGCRVGGSMQQVGRVAAETSGAAIRGFQLGALNPIGLMVQTRMALT
jgi:hypothetical protein